MTTINSTFQKLSQATTSQEIKDLLKAIDPKYHMNWDKYPPITFKITHEDVNELELDDDFSTKDLMGKVDENSALTKLLFAMAWKNGDLQKLKHIINGIKGEKDETQKNALVFYQFGKFLTKDNGEPIIDQHVLRAFGMYMAQQKPDKFKSSEYKNLTTITHKHRDLIEEYKEWLQSGLTEELKNEPDYVYHVDQVLFAMGKKLKVDLKSGSLN